MDADSKGPLYCAEQIKIPGELPDILKEFTKAAIRTQPVDLLQWAAAYFEALSRGETPPVKSRLEQPLPSADERLGGLSKGALAVLHKQLGAGVVVTVTVLQEKWKNVGCTQQKLEELLAIGEFSAEVDWQKLLALTCTSLESSLPQALKTMCEILSTDPEGGPARISFDQFSELYNFLSKIDGRIPSEQVASVLQFLQKEANRFEGKIGPRDFQHPSCPRLDAARHY